MDRPESPFKFPKNITVRPRGKHKDVLGDITGEIIDATLGMATVNWEGYSESAIMFNNEIEPVNKEGGV